MSPHLSHRRSWTATEDQYLRGTIGWHSPRGIAIALGRTIPSVLHRAKRLGISRWQFANRSIYCARDVARIFGVDDKAVSHIWIRTGALVAEQSAVGAGRHRRWRITSDAIERFIRTEVGRYDYHRVQEGTYWRQLAEEAQRDLLSAEQAARRLGVAYSTVLRHCRMGWLPAFKARGGIGTHGDWKIRGADLHLFQTRKLDALHNHYVKSVRERRAA